MTIPYLPGTAKARRPQSRARGLPHATPRPSGEQHPPDCVSRPFGLDRPSSLHAKVEHCRLSRASTTQAEVSSSAERDRHPTRVPPRPETTLGTTGAPPSHRIPGPQADARSPTEGDSEDSAPRHMASFRRQSRRTPRRSCDSTSTATRAGTRPLQRRKGVMRCRETQWRCR